MTPYNIPAPAQGAPQKTKFELMASGIHELEVVDATDVDKEGAPLVTRAGDPRIKIRVSNDEGQAFFHFLYLNDRAIGMVWEFLHACGVSADGESFDFDPPSLIGRKFMAEVYEEDGWNRLRRPRPVPTVKEQPTPDPAEPAPADPQSTENQFKQEDVDDEVPF